MRKKERELLTGDGLSDNGGVVVGMVARVEKMVMESSVEPVVEKLYRAGMEKSGKYNSIGAPHW